MARAFIDVRNEPKYQPDRADKSASQPRQKMQLGGGNLQSGKASYPGLVRMIAR